MLNLTDEEVRKFNEWKAAFIEEVDIRRETIKLVKPEDYQADELYMKLGDLYKELDAFTVTKGYAFFRVDNRVENERKFGSALETCLRRIEGILENKYSDLFADRCGDLLIIFGI